MKKFLVFFVVMFGIACSAMAGYQGTQVDPVTKENGACVLIPDDETREPYAVYFQTGKDAPSDECASYFNQVAQKITSLWNQGEVAYFVFVGSADTQGDGKGYDNVDLSLRRFNYVGSNTLPNEASQENRGWIAGSATDQKFDPKYGEKWQYRSVYIYPQWARSQCSQERIDNMNKNLTRLRAALKEYPNSADIKKLISNYEAALRICDVPNKSLTKAQAEELIDLLIDTVALIKTVSVQYNIDLEQTTVVNTEISTYYSKLSRIRDSLKLSAWRDAEGKFNTARLASDSIAGVVLGTVGGIVTSKLVKKNQLKKGFEDLSCNVGGQKVADYGDTFRVGMN